MRFPQLHAVVWSVVPALLQPSPGTNESIEDAFIAPPDNIQESRDAMEEVERYYYFVSRVYLCASASSSSSSSRASTARLYARQVRGFGRGGEKLQAAALRRLSEMRNLARVRPYHARTSHAAEGGKSHENLYFRQQNDQISLSNTFERILSFLFCRPIVLRFTQG